MTAFVSNVSPQAPKKSPVHFVIHEDEDVSGDASPQREHASGTKHTITPSEGAVPLVSSKLGNMNYAASISKKLKVDHPLPLPECENGDKSAMDTLLAKLSEQQTLLEKQKQVLSHKDNTVSDASLATPSSDSLPLTPVTESSDVVPVTESSDIVLVTDEDNEEEKTVQIDKVEMARLKEELDAAKDKIARQEHELSQTRAAKQNLDQSKSVVAAPIPLIRYESMDRTIGNLQDAYTAAHRPTSGFSAHDDAKSDVSDALSTGGMHRGPNIWSNPTGSSFNGALPPVNIWGQPSGRAWGNRQVAPTLAPLMVPQQSVRSLSGPTSPVSSGSGCFISDFAQYPGGNNTRRANNQGSRTNSIFSSRTGSSWDVMGSSGEMSPVMAMNPHFQPPMGMFQAPLSTYQPRPIGTPLSPTAAEFTAGGSGQYDSMPSSPGQTYASPLEPMNYRRLLDRNMTCNWKYIVDKIVCNNDQQASIFLQQKLKVGTAEQKFGIVEAIVAQAYPLMVNRFGNFLVQRCFEHGTPEQVVAIANAIRGNTLSLSMDSFGCHVVQKAFDAVPEEYKAIMVHELLRRIPETVIHRYACHVWQKLFELRWSDSPPQIMKYVNEALRGMWHDVALGETGSLVVQNIFENCLEEDKRPCINEVLNSIDIVAHGQFGNWCIQHICEHGAPADRARAIDHVLKYATEYSMDQFASKVVEKCLKIGGSEFLERYLARVCEGRPDRPRIPLIDISSDQYGNYLIQYILTHANAQHREVVASHIRKHMVSLRGSKFGSRVGMLCSNPAYATRPGPGLGAQASRFNGGSSVAQPRFNGPFR